MEQIKFCILSEYQRVPFNLSELSLSIVKENSDKRGVDFNKFLDQVLSNAIKESKFKECNEVECIPSRKRYNKSIHESRLRFIKCLAQKNNTTVSSVIEILLVKGLP